MQLRFLAPGVKKRSACGRSVEAAVLVVNASYEPIAICTAKRALKMWAKGSGLGGRL